MVKTYSIQEMIEKTTEQRQQIKQAMQNENAFHPEMANIFSGQKRSVERELRESLKRLKFSQLLEYLAKSGTTDIAGAAYLVPDKLSQTLYHAVRRYDIVPLLGEVITTWAGGPLKVNITRDANFKAGYFSSGGALPTETAEIEPATITPISFGIRAEITNEMIEDSQYGLIEWHASRAAQRVADLASDMALSILATGADGDGSANSSNTGDSAETRLTNGTTADVVDATRAVGDDQFIANTLVATPEAWGHSISTQAAEAGWLISAGQGGYDCRFGTLDVLLSTSPNLHAATDADGDTFTQCVTIIFDRNNALVTGRKRWLQVDNYSDPIKDLAGAVISARQDSVTVYLDSIYRLTEST